MHFLASSTRWLLLLGLVVCAAVSQAAPKPTKPPKPPKPTTQSISAVRGSPRVACQAQCATARRP